MKTLIRKYFFFLLLVGLACNKDDDSQTRSFYIGFTPLPYAISDESAIYNYERIEADADIINHHFDNGVPWEEALHDLPFHQKIMDDWNFRKIRTGERHKIYLSVTPLNFFRTGLASSRGESDNIPLTAPWDSYSFSHPDVQTAYINYCKRIIEFFEPDYFNMAIEANLFFVNKADQWSAYLSFHRQVFEQLKLEYPELPIFCSVAGAYLLPDFIDNNDHVQQRLAVLQLLEHSDYYGLSFYPYLSNYLGSPYPPNILDELFSISNKPLAITETGYAAQTFSMDTGSGKLVTIESDQMKQENYIKDLLQACDRRKALFVINFAIRDYDQLWQQIGSPNDINVAWRDSGLYDENGVPRLALSTWRRYLSRKHQR